jgi:putative toxin-antitoxin system antitoxin component (TIGR02293 family)
MIRHLSEAMMSNFLQTSEIAGISALLGGAETLKRTPRNVLEAHDMLTLGLPGAALNFLVDGLQRLEHDKALENAMGMSLRTFQRRRDNRDKPLNPDQSGRAWKFAEILTKAIAQFGSQEEAERWMQEPAMGLDNRRPLDLLATPAGVEMVETFLTRLEYGVYM